ncbi:MAG: hypothetical protein B6226_04915 [Candidatus Cloacimonetes bacterium 4572_65]|nr:MAG: hypothetical protein B6226_04915 [Candidatus Cloacimonetes bacterium 4572_65]
MSNCSMMPAVYGLFDSGLVFAPSQADEKDTLKENFFINSIHQKLPLNKRRMLSDTLFDTFFRKNKKKQLTSLFYKHKKDLLYRLFNINFTEYNVRERG